MHPALPQASDANLHFVTPQIAVGGDLCDYDDELAARQLVEICDLGITHVVDVRIEWSDEDVFADFAPHIDYLHHGLDDVGQTVPAEWFETAVDWVERAWAEQPDAVVLTHCHMGINRGPSLGFALLLSLGWNPVEAISAIRSARSQANVWYAEDALNWHHARTGTDPATAAAQHATLAAWRDANPLDVVRLIRGVREQERAAS
jgi:hypothetical protein